MAPVPGTRFGRYELLQKLGAGGMGEVYRARDYDLLRDVAVKFLPEKFARDPDRLGRFAQEARAASSFNHPSIVSIYEIGEVEGVPYIAMELIEGQTLRALLHGRPIPARQILDIAGPVADGLAKAHAGGIVHRDLKPENLMISPDGFVKILDFGLAKLRADDSDVSGWQETEKDTRTDLRASPLTSAGMVLGTAGYMAPEQARGGRVDFRSDQFSLGAILYEMGCGRPAFDRETVPQTLAAVIESEPEPLAHLNPALPAPLCWIIERCLAKDPGGRYASTLDLARELRTMREHLSEIGGSAPALAAPPPRRRQRYRLAAGVAAAAILAGLLLFFPARHGLRAPSEALDVVKAGHAPLTLLVADFENKTGDPIFEGTLEPAFNIAFEGASFISAYNRSQARRVGKQVRPDATVLDEPLARLVAVREGINAVIAGSIAPEASGYTLAVRAIDSATGKELASARAEAPNKEAVLRAVSTVSAQLRKALGDVTPESVQLAAAETFTSSSLEAAQHYGRANELQRSGQQEEALAEYQRAVQLDPDLGRAYAGMASTSANLGRRSDAERYFKLAFSKIDRMTDREKYRTRGVYYVFSGNTDKAIEELSELVKRYPSDVAGTGNLALAYFLRRDMPRAVEIGRRTVELNPRNTLQRTNLGLYAMYAGDFETALGELRAVIDASPEYAPAYQGAALSQLALGRIADAAASYRRLDSLSAYGASMAAMGLADLALYQGRTNDAVAILEKAAALDLAQKSPDVAATKLAVLAHALLEARRTPQAAAAADKAASLSKDMSVRFWAADADLALGREEKARMLAQELTNRMEREPQAWGRLIEAKAARNRGKGQDAIKLFREANGLADTWLGRFELARAYLDAGAPAEAHAELEVCLKRRGEALAVFLDDVPTFRLFPAVHYYLGRAQEALGSPAAAQSFTTFLNAKEGGTAGPLVADARRRLLAR